MVFWMLNTSLECEKKTKKKTEVKIHSLYCRIFAFSGTLLFRSARPAIGQSLQSLRSKYCSKNQKQ